MTGFDVEHTADALLRAGERPTIERVRAKLGTGSPNTINPLLDAWWKKLAARLDAGPAALHRLPKSVAHLAEGLWLQALDEGRRRAAVEQQSDLRTTAVDKQQLEIRSHVLSLREGELESRLRDREQAQIALEAQLQDLTTLLRKERATRESQARRIATLENELLARAQPEKTIRAARVTKKSPQPLNRRRAAELRKRSTPRPAEFLRKRNRRSGAHDETNMNARHFQVASQPPTQLRIPHSSIIRSLTGEAPMQTITDALTLLKRQAALESAMKQPGGIRITEEQELYTLRHRLNAFPEAMQAILQAAHALRRPVTEISTQDVEAWATAEQVA